jgi:hypothetical protein
MNTTNVGLLGLRGTIRVLVVLGVVTTATARFAIADDFEGALERATAKLEKLASASEQKMNAGDFTGANAALLAAFPEATRTPAESFLLGNLLFEVDRNQSYSLHKAAANAEPQNSAVVWEWALEQHRAGEFAGALASYRTFSKARPRSAASYALQADCLLRLNRVDEAVAAWRQSEDAPDGSIEAMESLVCAVHREPAPFARRAELLAKATRDRDARAAADLIALDCQFPRDWWNAGPQKKYLAHDAAAIAAALKLPADDVVGRAMACAAECAATDADDAGAIKAVLVKHRLLVDADRTIPNHGGLLTVLLAAARDAGVIDDATLRQQIGPKVYELAKKGRDAGLWNCAAAAGPEDAPDKLLALEREGWKATGDERFAAGVLLLKMKAGNLAGDDADLAAARKQFPDSGLVQRVAYEVAKRENTVTRDLLADAARAEFKHFSSFVAFATVVNRPRSDYLRQYFAELSRMPAAPKADKV